VESLGSKSEIFMTGGILMPIIIIVVVFAQKLMAESGLSAMDEISPLVASVILNILLAVLAVITITTKRSEPNI